MLIELEKVKKEKKRKAIITMYIKFYGNTYEIKHKEVGKHLQSDKNLV